MKVIVQTKSPSWLAPRRFTAGRWPAPINVERVIDITGNEQGGYGNVFFYLNGANAERVSGLPAGDPRAGNRGYVHEGYADLDEVVTVQDFAWSEQPWIRELPSAVPRWAERG